MVCSTFLTAVLILVAFATDSVVAVKSYDGYSFIRAIPTNGRQLRYLKNLSEAIEFENSPIEFWRESCCLNQSFDMLISPAIKDNIFQNLNSLQVNTSVLIENIGELIESQRLQQLRGRADGEEVDYFADYRPINEMFNFLEQLRLMNPADSEIEITGKSFEGRDLRLLKIGISGDKPIIWIDGGTHAREWIGPATNMYMAYQVALAKQQCSKDGPCDAETRHLVETYDWYFQPSVNPDGYEFSQKNDRLWRKTRSESNIAPWGVMCRGADPNRNYKANWGKDGSSGNPCSQTYAGTHYHSEAEILALTNKVSTIADRIRMFISLHSYSQIFLLPYGYTDEIPPEYDELERVAIQGAEALKARRGTEYRIGSSARILYAASGTASDWAFETSKIKYSYTFELPDTGDKGFVLPAEEIRPVGDETWAGVRAMVLALP